MHLVYKIKTILKYTYTLTYYFNSDDLLGIAQEHNIKTVISHTNCFFILNIITYTNKYNDILHNLSCSASNLESSQIAPATY